MEDVIRIRGARVNNLKNCDIDIPLRKITCFTGPSGSGKTSIAFHTILNESKRRFINSFPNSLKLFTEKPAPVDVDSIAPVKPVFGLPQINPTIGTRSNVMDTMGLTGIVQNIFYKLAGEYCPEHFLKLHEKSPAQQLESLVDLEDEFVHFFVRKEDFLNIIGAKVLPTRVWNEEKCTLEFFHASAQFWELFKCKLGKTGHIDAFLLDEKGDLLFDHLLYWDSKAKEMREITLISGRVCPICDFKENKSTSAKSFSPLSAQGACPECDGFGEQLFYEISKLIDLRSSYNNQEIKIFNQSSLKSERKNFLAELKHLKIQSNRAFNDYPVSKINSLMETGKYFSGFKTLIKKLERKKYKTNIRILLRSFQETRVCQNCHGTRYNPSFFNFYLPFEKYKINIRKLVSGSIDESMQVVLKYLSSEKINKEGKTLLTKYSSTLKLAKEMGLGHVKLLRKTKTLSAGEYQRVLLLKYLSFEGTDSLFIFDEPSIGLDKNQIDYLLRCLNYLKAQGNTIVLIDHSKYIQTHADFLIEMGPGSGDLGGKVIKSYQVQSSEFKKNEQYFDRNLLREIKSHSKNSISVGASSIYDLKFKKFHLERNKFYQVQGASGCGKTSLFVKVLANELSYLINDKYLSDDRYQLQSVKGHEGLEDIIVVDANLNRYTSRSTLGSMTELAKVVRQYFANLRVSKSLGLTERHFNSNTTLGQCEKCEGKGVEIYEMQFLDDIVIQCEMCKGKKLKEEYAEITDGKRTIHEAFNQPVSSVLEGIQLTPKFQKILNYIKKLKLDYLSLDRQINSLSGGEKQRIYLLSKMIKKVQNSVIIFENLSFGLSETEIHPIAEFLAELKKQNNTLILLDRNELFSHYVDHIIEIDSEQNIKVMIKQ
jgi:excinuclease ABC subunit A